MDVAAYLQCFESSISSYTGDDPLDQWDKFVEYMEQRLPPDGTNAMSLVLNSLVEKFLHVEQYANDVRYVNYCIKCASYYQDPIALYSHIFSKGIGAQTAVLYVAWAQQFEQKGLNEQADAVYQKAMENQAQPADTVLHEYRQFQARTRSQTTASGGRNPLQNSHLTNQMSTQRELAPQSKVSVDCPPKPAEHKTTIIVSRSETSGMIPSSSNVQTVPAYNKDDLVCEGSELCFEEVRAERYFHKLQEEELRTMKEKLLRKQEEDILSIRSMLEKVNQDLEACGGFPIQKTSQTSERLSMVETSTSVNPNPTQQPFGCPRPSNRLSSRRSLGLRLHTDPTFIQEAVVTSDPPQQQNNTTRDASPVQPLSVQPLSVQALSVQALSVQPLSVQPLSVQALSVQALPVQALPVQALPVQALSVQPLPVQPLSVQPLPVQALPVQALSVQPLPVQALSVQPLSVQALSVQALPVLQPTGFEQMNMSLHRPACSSDDNGDVFRRDSGFQTSVSEIHNTQHHENQPLEPEEKLNMSQGGTANLSHVTPNTSLGYVQATPSRVLPSPTVNTREALDVIMDMFQAPTLLEDTFSNTSVLHTAEKEPDPGFSRNGVSSFTKPPASAPFIVFQDNDDKENGSSAPAAGGMLKPVRALAEIPMSKPSKPNETPSDLMPDESTMWGARYNSLNSLAACPNSTSDFAMLAQFVSTPFTHKTPFNGNFYQDQENCDGAEGDEEAYVRRQTKKLSPIIEQSPSEEKLSETAVSRLLPSSARQGTIVGEGLASAQHCLTSSSITMVQPPPPAVLSFRDHTLCPTESSVHKTTGPGWEVYTSPESKPQSSVKPKSEPFTIIEEFDEASNSRVQKSVEDVPMSPECAPKPDWLSIRSPVCTVEPDLDAFLSPRQPRASETSRIRDVPMSPQQQLCADVPMSPMQQSDAVDEPMMSPDRGPTLSADVSMNQKTPRTVRSGSAPLVSDPWDNELISGLLSTLNPPLTSHPRCISWQCNIPNITSKTTISMGKASLRVDCVLGEGAFATVYQATDPMTSEKVVLKVQKPANPWEFYINTQLDARLQRGVRHLYSSLHSAHLFHNGSVLLGELHNYGTLLNTVNIYKTLSDKVMPQPLVLYFTICILHMVEQLHSIGIVHADVKPDNFLLGERFLENKCFESDNVDHGLVLIDLGQSIDMQLFPQGTAFTARCLTSGFQCTEMQSGKPWNYQTDYFGVAGTVHCLLFGTYMKVMNEGGVWKTNGVFRRNPHSDLWMEFFHALLNVPDCRSLPDLRSLRCKLTSVLQQNYSNKLPTLKSRLVVLLLESRKAARR